MASPAGRSVELYYVDGRSDGTITARMYNWTGQLVSIPRTQLADGLSRSEVAFGGVYILTGEMDGEPMAYIGESDAVGYRIKNHDTKKDWWTSAVLVTAAENQLNKAHVRYLEARLIQEARRIGRMPLENGTSPPRPTLSEADTGKMEEFLERLLFVLPSVRVDMFVERTRPTSSLKPPGARSNSELPRFALTLRKHGLQATALLSEGDFVVEAGSLARLSWESAEKGKTRSYAHLHDELRREGVLVTGADHCVFAKNYAFSSPSAAAAVVMGRPANGATEWRTEDGTTYKEWERRALAPA